MRGRCINRVIAIPIPPSFIKAMQNKLNVNSEKGDWKDCSVEYLYQRLLEEVQELIVARNNGGDVRDECVDVANFSMMLYDVIPEKCPTCGGKGTVGNYYEEYPPGVYVPEQPCPDCGGK